MSKKYGLILPDKEKKQPVFQARRNVFGDDNDSDDEPQKKTVMSANLKRKTRIEQSKAVIEDPTVYQYDEIYDELKVKATEEKQKVKADKNPKYIENLLKSANKRKIENERRVERQVQKEREKEGDEFADKEVFVTSAYKKKLEEMRKEDEKEKYEEYLEQIGDVTKQKDLGGFYRHLYEQKLGPANNIEASDSRNPKEKEKEGIANNETKDQVEKDANKDKSSKMKVSRNYRKRKISIEANTYLSEGEIVSDEEINRLNLDDIKAAKKIRQDENLDADSDFSVNDPSDSESENETKPQNSSIDNKIIMQTESRQNSKTDKVTKEESSEHKGETKDKVDKSPKKPPEEKQKIDIWKKRTVGIVFEEALKRYYERKASKGM